MRFWWVNHKQTARQELTGGYLWSPKTEARGTRSQFYDNMRKGIWPARAISDLGLPRLRLRVACRRPGAAMVALSHWRAASA